MTEVSLFDTTSGRQEEYNLTIDNVTIKLDWTDIFGLFHDVVHSFAKKHGEMSLIREIYQSGYADFLDHLTAEELKELLT